MGFDSEKISLVNNSLKSVTKSDFIIYINGEKVSKVNKLSSFCISTKAAPGWDKYLNK